MEKNIMQRVDKIAVELNVVRTFTKELTRARNLLKNIISSLESCDANTNFKEKIGVYACRMPDFINMKEERISYISYIRQICTGELEPEEALKLFREEKKQVDEALDYIKI